MRKKLPEVAGIGLLIFLVALVVFLYFLTQRPGIQPPMPPGPRAKPFEMNPSKYSTTEYIAPLGPEETGDDSFFSAQIRGVVSSWGEDLLAVAVGEDVVEVDMPDKVMLRCLPSVATDSKGQTYKPSEVFVDFRGLTVKGEVVESSTISGKIPEGADITVQVKYGETNQAEAHLIVGYGCTM